MSNKILTAAWKEMLTTGNERLLLLALADQANDEGECWPSLKTLRVKVNVSDNRSIRRLCESLEAKKYITRTPRSRENRSTTSNLFQINFESFVESVETDTPRTVASGGEGSSVRGGRVPVSGGGGFQRPPYEPSVESICEPPTNQPDVVDTQKQTSGKPMLDSYNNEQGPAVPVYYGADGKVYRCRGGEEPIGTARIADKPSAGSGAVVGGLDSSMSGGEDPFYDGQVVEDEEYDLDMERTYDKGYLDGQGGAAMNPDFELWDSDDQMDYLAGYAAGEKRAKARQAAPAREIKVLCVAPPLSTPHLASHYDRADIDAGAQTQNRPEAEVTQVTKAIPAQPVVVDTAPVGEWSEKTRKYGAQLEGLHNEWLWSDCLQNLKSEDMMYLQREKLKAKSNPLGYVRNAMIRLLMLEFETRTNPKAANQPTTAPRPTDGPASHRLLVNDDPERERKLAEMEALAGLGPVPEHMKIRRKKKEVQ